MDQILIFKNLQDFQVEKGICLPGLLNEGSNDNLEMWSVSKCGPQKQTISITRALVRSADLWVPHKFTESYSLGCASEVNIITRSRGEWWQILACLL